MTPISLLAAQKFYALLTAEGGLSAAIDGLSASLDAAIPNITSGQVLLSSAPPELSDRNLLLSYPRISVYSSSIRNSQIEKFRSFSGEVGVIAEIWASADLITQADDWIHFYIEGVTDVLRRNIGDWGDGIFFPGGYEVQIQAPKQGGFGFVESAKLSLKLNVSLF